MLVDFSKVPTIVSFLNSGGGDIKVGVSGFNQGFIIPKGGSVKMLARNSSESVGYFSQQNENLDVAFGERDGEYFTLYEEGVLPTKFFKNNPPKGFKFACWIDKDLNAVDEEQVVQPGTYRAIYGKLTFTGVNTKMNPSLTGYTFHFLLNVYNNNSLEMVTKFFKFVDGYYLADTGVQSKFVLRSYRHVGNDAEMNLVDTSSPRKFLNHPLKVSLTLFILNNFYDKASSPVITRSRIILDEIKYNKQGLTEEQLDELRAIINNPDLVPSTQSITATATLSSDEHIKLVESKDGITEVTVEF